MSEYLYLSHMSEFQVIQNDNSSWDLNAYFISYHGVLLYSNKIHIVFNASSKCLNGISLNDSLLIGPALQTSIIHVLIR